ncbi:MAG: sodium:solute symporter family protein [Myxococcota bacterium]
MPGGGYVLQTSWPWIDVAIILGFIAYAVASGLFAKDQASKSLDEYFLAGRSLPGWKAGLSMAATQFAADTPLRVTGQIATIGIFALWQDWIYGVAFLLLGYVLAPAWRRAGVITDAELSERRYAKTPAAILRGTKAIYLGTIFNCIVLGWVLFAATRIAEPFLTWHLWLPAPVHEPFVSVAGLFDRPLVSEAAKAAFPEAVQRQLAANNLISILVIVAVTTFYSTTGGLRSVVNTDVAQFVLMAAGTVVFVYVISDRAGGITEVPDLVRARFADGGPCLAPGHCIDPDQILGFTPSVAHEASIALAVVFALQWLIQLNADGTGYLAQRSMACRSDEDAKVAGVVFAIAQVFVRSLLWLPLGLALLLLFPPDLTLVGEAMKGDREFTYVLGINELPPGVKGLMLTAMLAALASTVDTHINWGSSYWTNDIYKRFVCEAWRGTTPSDRSLVWVARGANLFILAVAMFIMTRLSSIDTAWRISLLLGSGLGLVLVLRWLWWRITAWAELTSIVVSLSLAVLLIVGDVSFADTPLESFALNMLLMAVVPSALAILVAIFGPREDPDHLRAFYRRARPPGYWGPIAALVDGADAEADARRLHRGLAATFASAGAIFSLLTAVGSTVVDSPPPTWFPSALGFRSLCLLVGLTLVPVAFRLGFREGPRSDDGVPAE